MHTDLCDFKQPLEVILSLWSHETIEGEGGKVADCHLSVKDRGTHDTCLQQIAWHLVCTDVLGYVHYELNIDASRTHV